MSTADRKKALRHIVLPVSLTGFAFLFTWLAGPFLAGSTFVLFLAAALVSALLAGWEGGILATVLGAAAGGYLLASAEGRMAAAGLRPLLGVPLFLLVALLGTSIIASRRKIAEALRGKQEEIDWLLAGPVGIQWTSGDGRILRANRAETDLLGYRPGEIEGLRFEDLHADPGEAGDLLHRVMAAGAVRGWEGHLRCRDGSLKHVVIDAIRIGTNGSPIIQSCISDITERKKSEEASRKAREAAEAAVQARDRFFAALSHELRAPLTPVLIAAAQQEEAEGLPEEIRQMNTLIRRNVELEARIIDNLLDLTLIRKGKLELDISTVNAHALIKNVSELSQSEILRKELQLDLDLRANRCHLRADSARLHQVFWNLIRNAVKYTPAGGRITVRSADMPGGLLRIEMIDSGVGIEKFELPRIFDPFDGPAPIGHGAGLGLGLAISRAVIEAHRGTLTADSKGKGQGSTFTIQIPAMDESFLGQPLSRLLSPEATRISNRILLVEDHEDSARLISQLLRRFNYHVTAAGTFMAAVRAAAQEEFDILVSDIGLPDGNGLDLLGELRKRRPVQGIALTGFGMEADVKMSRDAGFAEHLTKPVNFHKLLMTIERVSAPHR